MKHELTTKKDIFLTKEDAQLAFKLLVEMAQYLAFSDDGDYFIGNEGEEFNDLCANIETFVDSIKH